MRRGPCSNGRSQIDPNDADALAGERYTYMIDYVFGWTIPEIDYDAKVLGQADRALALAPDSMPALLREELLPGPFAPP